MLEEDLSRWPIDRYTSIYVIEVCCCVREICSTLCTPTTARQRKINDLLKTCPIEIRRSEGSNKVYNYRFELSKPLIARKLSSEGDAPRRHYIECCPRISIEMES